MPRLTSPPALFSAGGVAVPQQRRAGCCLAASTRLDPALGSRQGLGFHRVTLTPEQQHEHREAGRLLRTWHALLFCAALCAVRILQRSKLIPKSRPIAKQKEKLETREEKRNHPSPSQNPNEPVLHPIPNSQTNPASRFYSIPFPKPVPNATPTQKVNKKYLKPSSWG